jgi:hypothetical protein
MTFSANRDTGYVSVGGVADPTVIKFVKVNAQKTIPLAFMTIMSWTSSIVPACAVAGMSPPVKVPPIV